MAEVPRQTTEQEQRRERSEGPLSGERARRRLLADAPVEQPEALLRALRAALDGA
jgi:hypothetical protein